MLRKEESSVSVYQYYEILGSENPIYKTKPQDLFIFAEIPNGDLYGYIEVGYLEVIESAERLYEPLYAKEGE